MAQSSSSSFKPDDNLLRQWFAQMQEFRSNGTFCDITVKVENKEIQAHRVILAASIPFFSRMLQSNFRENRKKKVEIKEIVDPDTLQNLINVSYGVDLEINQQNAEKLLVGADYLQLDHVKTACRDFYKSQLSPENVLGTKRIAEKFHCPELVSAAEKFVDNNFSLIAKTDEFMELERHDLMEIIKRDQLKAKEEEVYEAVMKWIKYEGPDRISLLPEVLSSVRLCLLSPLYLSETVHNESLIKVSSECRDLLEEAMKFHLLVGIKKLPETFLSRPRSVPGLIYILGGQNRKGLVTSVQTYNIQEDKWTIEKYPLKAKKYAASTVFEGKLYMFGGKSENGQCSSVVEVLDFESKNVTRGSNMVSIFASGGATVLNDGIYIIGGHDGSRNLNSTPCYSPKLNTWTECASLNLRRNGCGAVILNGQIFVIGGFNGTQLNSCERFNPASNTWTNIKPMASPRNYPGVAVLDDKIYVCGGDVSNESVTNSIEIYDPVEDFWTIGAAMKTARTDFALISHNRKLYAIGGWSGSNFLSSAEIFDPETNSWSFVSSLPLETCGMSYGLNYN